MKMRIALAAFCLMLPLASQAGAQHASSVNYGYMAMGGIAMFGGGLISAFGFPGLGVSSIMWGAYAVGYGGYDEFFADKPVESSFLSDMEADGWKEANELIQRNADKDERNRWRARNEQRGKDRFKEGIKNVGRNIRSGIRNLFGSKPANAGELEPLQPIEQFIAENSADKIRNRGKSREKRKNGSPQHGRKRGTTEQSPKSGSTDPQPDLHGLDLDNPNGDWCKCSLPGCSANMDATNGLVIFGCSKCKKVNVKYAKMALELEQKMKSSGTTPTWYGPNAEANAHKAAGK